MALGKKPAYHPGRGGGKGERQTTWGKSGAGHQRMLRPSSPSRKKSGKSFKKVTAKSLRSHGKSRGSRVHFKL